MRRPLRKGFSTPIKTSPQRRRAALMPPLQRTAELKPDTSSARTAAGSVETRHKFRPTERFTLCRPSDNLSHALS